MMKGLVMIRWMLVVVVLCVVEAGASPLADEVRVKASAILDSVEDRATAERALDAMRRLADAVIEQASDRQLDALGVSEGFLATAEILVVANESGMGIGAFADSLAASPEFVIELGLLVDPEHDDLNGVAELAKSLLEQRGELIEQYPTMSSALCVVHESPFGYSRQINENTVKAPSVLEIFDYFVKHSGRLPVHPNRLSPALLVHVVDMTERPEQSGWALNRYRANPGIGDRFFEIQYDYAHFRSGAPKRVTTAGDYRLESILQYGGVCADQAYFAEGVAKACSIPSAYVHARGADVSHAWIGYLEVLGNRAEWNFESGRYPEYQNLRGNLRDPQTLEYVSDARVGLLGGQYGVHPSQRWSALGVTKAVGRMHSEEWDAGGDVVFESKGTLRIARGGTVKDQLALLRSGLTRCAFVPGGWELIAEIADENELSKKELDVWARAVEKMCGVRYQDFSFDIIAELISSVDEERSRVGMWEWVLTRYKSRPDLVAAALIELGALHEELGELERAWWRYEAVSKELINDGPMVMSALWRMRSMLDSRGKRSEIVPWLEDAAQRVNRPPSMGAVFATQSNYFRIHMMLGEELELAGRSRESRAVYESIGVRVP
ncbi:MAG: hypothetical protein JJ974_02155 [Phycisphaerales bacterium]|nr:hypothetical protein [Phycisphaerales bacterium]